MALNGPESNFLGYNQLLKTPTKGVVLPDALLLDNLVEANPDISKIFDPRGNMKSGMVPSRQLGYRVFYKFSPQVGLTAISQGLSTLPESFAALFGLGTFGSTFDVQLLLNFLRTSVVCFEGRDVIDLPIDGLPRDGNRITLPDRVFRILHAGENRFLSPGEDLAQKSILSPFASDNLVVSMVPTEDITDDIAVESSKTFVDTASNIVEVSGNPNFISYVSVDKPIFRDVVYSSITAQAFGFAEPGNFRVIDADIQSISFHILRFAFTEIPKGSQNGEPQTGFAWRLSESWNVDPKGKSIQKTPKDLYDSLTPAQKEADDLDAQFKHFAYDISEDAQDVSDPDNFVQHPGKTAYSPALARAKKAIGSGYFQVGFASNVSEVSPGFAAGGLTTAHLAIASSTNRAVDLEYSVTAPTTLDDISREGRIGIEYSRIKVGTGPLATTVGVVDETQLLAKTVESTDAISALYDPSLGMTTLVDTVSVSDGSILTERIIDDVIWAKNKRSVPASELDTMLAGEFPNRSVGKPVFNPIRNPIGASINEDSGSIDVPDGARITLLKFLPGRAESVFKMTAGAGSGDAVMEFSAENAESKDIKGFNVEIPPLDFGGYVTGGGLDLGGVFGYTDGEDFLSAQTQQNVSGPTDFQQANISAQTLPVLGSNPSMACDRSRGKFYLAFENEDRIDIAIKNSHNAEWILIRDVVLRMQDDFDELEDPAAGDIPPARMPFLLSDSDTGTLFLFYAYKGNLLVKHIPLELLDITGLSSGIRTSQRELDAEKSMSTSLEKSTSYLVYDGSGEKENGALAAEARFGFVVDKNPRSESTDETQSPKSQVSQYSAFVDKAGNYYVMIESGGKMTIKKSVNACASWTDITPVGFSMVPAGEDEDIQEFSPYLLHDGDIGILIILFFYDGALVQVRFPVEGLKESNEEIGLLFSGTLPEVLIGPLSEETAAKGIARIGPELSEGETNPARLSPHRVSAIITSDGYYRVFFKDSEGKIKSLISVNSGISWVNESQFLSIGQ